MAFLKIVVILAAVAAHSSFAVPITTAQSALRENEVEPTVPRDYSFNYDIQDGIVGMSHARSETHRAGVTRGFYSYTRPDGILVKVTYTADETGFHPVITEEAAPNMITGRSMHMMDIHDHPEKIVISITEEDMQRARQQSKAYTAAAIAAAAASPTPSGSSVFSSIAAPSSYTIITTGPQTQAAPMRYSPAAETLRKVASSPVQTKEPVRMRKTQN